MPFDPSTAQLFDPESATLVEESKKKSPAEMVYEKMRPSVNESLSSLQGLGEAGLNVLSGMFGGGLGALSGAIAGIREHGLGSDEQRKKVEAEAARQAHELTFVPRTEKGQEYAEKAGKVVEQLIPVMPMMAELEGAAMATRGARSLKKEAKQAQASESLRKVGGFDPETAIPLDEAIKQADKVNAPRSEIVPDVVSEVNPARDRAMQRRQMELDLGVEQPVRFNKQGEPVREAGTRFESHSDVLNVDNQGQIFKGEAPDFAYEAAKRREAEALAEPPGVPQQAELLPTINPYDVGGHVSRLREGEVTALDTPQGELFGTAVRPDEMAAPAAEAARQADFLENARQGEMFSTEAPPAEIPGVAVPGQPDFFSVTEMAKRKKEETTQAMVDSHPVVKALEAKVDTAIARLEELKAANADAAKVQKALRDVGIAKAKVDTARKNLSKPGGKTTLMYEGLGETAKRTGQAVRYGRGMANAVDKAIENWKNKSAETVVGENKRQYFKNLPGLKERLGDILPEQRPMSEIITELTQRPDIDQNMVQKGINQLSAGLSYIAQKTNNLMLKKTYERVSEAYDRAQLLNRTFIQKDLVPAMRELNLREKGEIWGRMLMAEGKETLTPQQLRVEGFSDKQIKMYEHYREAADYALKSINEARAVAGKKPIDARTGYVAGVFSGDFRRVLYSTVDGKRQVVGVVGDNTRIGLNRTIERIKENHPEWEIGEEKYMGGTGRSLGERQKAFEEALEFLAENDTNIQTLMETYKESMLSDAYNYLNQKKHTKQKKGVMGSEGMKEWETVEKNALEGMKAQIRYLETSYKWAELSKATKELEPMLSDANINMPNAKNLANKYIDRALGLSDNDFAKGISTMMDGIAKTFGVGPSVISSTARGAKNITSKQLLGYANVPFLAINAIQPITGMPAMMTFLSGRGVDASALGKASFKAADMLRDRNPTGFNKEALKFADEHGIMTSEIFDHSNNIQTGFQYYNDKVAEVGITQVEQATRASVFFTLAHALHESGLKPKDGLFEGAQRLTNMMMTDYRQIETPAIFSNFGAAGHLAANLVRYKHNQFSLMSMYAREVKNNGSYKPFGVAMATNIATAGILGMIGFQEADALYQMFSKAIGKPDTLTNVVLQNADTLSAHGIFSAATGLDLSNRLGLQDVVPNSMGEALFPGGGRLVEMAEAVPQLMGNNVDRARAARALAPNSLRGVIDRTFFEDSEGRSIDPKTLTPIVKRSTEDKVAKSVGLTGVKESDTKAKLYQQRLIDKQYAEIRKGALRTIIDDAYQGKDLNQEAVQKYLDAEGDPNTLSNAIVKFKTNQKMTEYQRRLLATSTAGSVNQARRLQRLKEAGIE